MRGKFFSPGKLLLTSEYFVLDGALALAVPTKPGQELFIEEKHDGCSNINWSAYHQGKFWLSAQISYSNWEILDTNNREAAEFVVKVLQNVQRLSSTKFHSGNSYDFRTDLQFPPDFGLGSSSTLMNNLAEWAQIDPFELNSTALGGSGYDIAVAREKSALLFRLDSGRQIIQKISFEPSFANDLLLIHLNCKQDSRAGIDLYRKKAKSPSLTAQFSEITHAVLNALTISDFSHQMQLHEDLIADFLGIAPVKSRFFADCPVFVKSLGAWGGDFVLSAKFEGYRDYFAEKGFRSVFGWNEIVF